MRSSSGATSDLARTGHASDAARALTFVTLVVAILVVIMINRSWTRSAIAMLRVPNIALRWVVLCAATLLTLALVLPFAQRLFHFAPLHVTDVVLSVGAGIVCVLWFELLKRARRRATAHIATAVAGDG